MFIRPIATIFKCFVEFKTGVKILAIISAPARAYNKLQFFFNIL
jgi:hypothetical protein